MRHKKKKKKIIKEGPPNHNKLLYKHSVFILRLVAVKQMITTFCISNLFFLSNSVSVLILNNFFESFQLCSVYSNKIKQINFIFMKYSVKICFKKKCSKTLAIVKYSSNKYYII